MRATSRIKSSVPNRDALLALHSTQTCQAFRLLVESCIQSQTVTDASHSPISEH